MSLNNTPSSERIHIGIFGKRNAGKSSLINALTGQNLAIVSNVKGTTTDPVPKAMELLPLGPVVMIDTPGLDDDGKLGPLRIQKAYQILNKTDIAVLVVDGTVGMTKEDEAILEKIKDKSISCVIVMNKGARIHCLSLCRCRHSRDLGQRSRLYKHIRTKGFACLSCTRRRRKTPACRRPASSLGPGRPCHSH